MPEYDERLAAAAPALLAALQDLLDALPAHSFPGTDVAQAVQAAQEAVRLATGDEGKKRFTFFTPTISAFLWSR